MTNSGMVLLGTPPAAAGPDLADIVESAKAAATPPRMIRFIRRPPMSRPLLRTRYASSRSGAVKWRTSLCVSAVSNATARSIPERREIEQTVQAHKIGKAFRGDVQVAPIEHAQDVKEGWTVQAVFRDQDVSDLMQHEKRIEASPLYEDLISSDVRVAPDARVGEAADHNKYRRRGITHGKDPAYQTARLIVIKYPKRLRMKLKEVILPSTDRRTEIDRPAGAGCACAEISGKDRLSFENGSVHGDDRLR
jgi:hypothetical protein